MPPAPAPTRVLFLCVHNSARSQMAEGLLRVWGGTAFDAHSAGSVATEVRPLAIRALAEIGVDIRAQRSKTSAEYEGDHFDWVVTVCNDALESCPYFPNAGNRDHWDLADPAAATGSEEERLAAFRRTRDEIAARVRAFIAGHAPAPTRP